MFFFFQAEDGIRDGHVTGVQTCALPISPEQAHAQPVQEPPTSHQEESPEDSPAGPRDYQVADEIVEDFQPPEPQPIASRSPRAVLSWFGVKIGRASCRERGWRWRGDGGARVDRE